MHALHRASTRAKDMLSFCLVFAVVSQLSLVSTRAIDRHVPPQFDHGVDLPTTRPLNVAHRGSSGSLPEHTVFAYQRAVDEGADVIECDLTVSKDLALLCMHENWMNGTTNVADVYPLERSNSYFVDDIASVVTDYFAIDFTLAELKSVVRKRQRFSFRDPNYNDILEISTFDEFLQVAKNAGRPVGLHVETKDPVFINSHPVVSDAGTTLEDLLLESLVANGYNIYNPREPVFIQSFDETSLRYFSNNGVTLPLVMLVENTEDVTDDRLQQLAEFAYGIGPSKRLIVGTNRNNQISGRTDLVSRSHAVGLRVHPYTMRNEHEYLAWDYRQDPQLEHQEYFDIGVDGVFTDFPLTYRAFLDVQYAT